MFLVFFWSIFISSINFLLISVRHVNNLLVFIFLLHFIYAMRLIIAKVKFTPHCFMTILGFQKQKKTEPTACLKASVFIVTPPNYRNQFIKRPKCNSFDIYKMKPHEFFIDNCIYLLNRQKVDFFEILLKCKKCSNKLLLMLR